MWLFVCSLAHRTASPGPYGSSSSLIGRSKAYPNQERDSLTSLARCIKLRSSLARMGPFLSTAGENTRKHGLTCFCGFEDPFTPRMILPSMLASTPKPYIVLFIISMFCRLSLWMLEQMDSDWLSMFFLFISWKNHSEWDSNNLVSLSLSL